MEPIEGRHLFVRGIDDNRIRCDFAAECTREGVHEHLFAKPMAAMPLIHGQTAEQGDGQQGVARQPFA